MMLLLLFVAEAYEEFGDKDIQYMNILINDKLNKEKFDEAESLINKALASNPNNPELINLQGLILENKKMRLAQRLYSCRLLN